VPCRPARYDDDDDDDDDDGDDDDDDDGRGGGGGDDVMNVIVSQIHNFEFIVEGNHTTFHQTNMQVS